MKGLRKVMKSVAISLTVALAATAMPSYVQAEENVSVAITDADFLKADGKNLRNQSGAGEIVNLRGTNAGGYLTQEFWMTPTESTTNVNDQKEVMEVLTERFGEVKMYELVDSYETAYWTEADFDNCVAMGMNCIRLPFWWRNLVDEEGIFYGYDADAEDPYATAFARMDWFVEEAAERGLYVVIDFHGAPGSQNGSDHSGVDGGDDKVSASEFWFGDNAESNQELFYDMWEVIAARYAGNPAVAGYDLMNEPFCTYRYSSPNGLSGDDLHEMLWGVYDKAYDAIRAIDADHVIIMEAVWDAGDLPNPVLYGWENVMYEYHNYLYDDYNNANGGQISNMESKLNGIANADYNVPSYMGEFCYFDNLDAWDEGLELLVNAGINWTTWTYKTVDTYGNWGLYHHPVNMNTGINLETATYDEILSWWQKVGTEEGEANTGLVEVVSKWCEADTVANDLGPQYADIEEGIYYIVGNNSQRVLANTGDAEDNMIGAIGLDLADSNDVKFEIIKNDDNTVSLRSLENNKYVSVNTEDKLLRATADSITDTEKFYMMQSSATAVAFKSVATQLFACVDETLESEKDYFEEGFPIVADRTSATSWETFNIYTMDKDLLGDVSDDNYSGWTHYETEDAAVATVVGGVLEAQDFYSDGQAAGSMGTDNVQIENVAADWSNIKYVAYKVTVDTAGSYKLVMTYNGDDDKKILVKVGDGEAAVVEVPNVQADHAWNAIHEKAITVDLQAGENTVYISGTVGGGWMNLDCIDVVNVPIVKNADGSERLEGENYYTNGAVEGQSFYSGGKGVGSLNSNTAFESIAANWSNIKYVDFTVYAEEAGEYVVTWAWNGNGADGMTAVYSLNGGENVALTLDNAGAGWDSMTSTQFEITLNKGFNDLRLSGTIAQQSNWANIDYIDIVRDGEQIEVVELPGTISGWSRMEGEIAATLVNGGGQEAQDFFSNGKAVSGLSTDAVKIEDVASDWSNIPYAEFTVSAVRAGDYRMAIGYNGDDDKTVALQVNGGETQNVFVGAVQDDHAWNAMHEKSLMVSLKEGENTIRISGALGGGWWNIDYIDISNVPVVIDATTGAERYEAEDFDNKSANNPAVEHQDFYSGAAQNNGVGGMGATQNGFTVGSEILGTNLNYTDFSVFVEEAGTYDITVAGNGAGNDMTCVYQLNSAASASFVLPNAGCSWDHMVYATIQVELAEGYNRLILAGTFDGSWLNYDYIDVVAAEETEDGDNVVNPDEDGSDTDDSGDDEGENGSDDTAGDSSVSGGDAGDSEGSVSGGDAGTDEDDKTGDNAGNTGSDDTTGDDAGNTGSDDAIGNNAGNTDNDNNTGNSANTGSTGTVSGSTGGNGNNSSNAGSGNNSTSGTVNNTPSVGNTATEDTQTKEDAEVEDVEAEDTEEEDADVEADVEDEADAEDSDADDAADSEDVEVDEEEADDSVTEDVVEDTEDAEDTDSEGTDDVVEIEDEQAATTAPVKEHSSNILWWIILAVVLGAAVIVGTKIYFVKRENKESL